MEYIIDINPRYPYKEKWIADKVCSFLHELGYKAEVITINKEKVKKLLKDETINGRLKRIK